MRENAIRVYVDTSVFGGIFDPEFSKPSLAFFDYVREGKFALVISPVVSDELQEAPESVQSFLRI